MPQHVLSGPIRRTYRRYGWAVVPRLFSTAECAAIKAVVDGIDPGAAPPGIHVRVADLATFQRRGVSKAEAGRAVFIFGDLTRTARALSAVIADRRLTSIAAAALGTTRLRFHFANFTRKAARIGPAISLHRDFPNFYISPRSSDFCRVMLCLDGMTRRGGATTFVGGSHVLSDARARRIVKKRRIARHSQIQIATCPPGSVVVIHPKVLHGGGPNRSINERDNLIVQWGSARTITFTTSASEFMTGAAPEALRAAISTSSEQD